ncbi:Kielin/chordin-like protein [Apodemus speciosus]|uniref:Kielin/chordin-like protein n=1 Tax=Apodemus speciosus TaxID=105296 RepID=A0ABQ0EUC1_APOSI
MTQATTPRHPRLPCGPEQALTLYRLLFQRPADLGQLHNALRQVRERGDCPPGLELPMVLLEMEGSQQAQEKLLWDLELVTGVGLGLFWPPWARFYSQRNQPQHARSPFSQSWGRSVGGDFEELSSQLCPPPQAGEAHSGGENHQLLKGRLATDSSSASDLDEARSEGDPRLEGPIVPARAAPGTPTGEGQEASGAGAPGADPGYPGTHSVDQAGCLQPCSSSSFQAPAGVESTWEKATRDPGKMEERSQAEPDIWSSCGQTLRSTQEGELGQEGAEPAGLAAQGLSALQDPSRGLGSGLSQERAEPHTLLTPQGYPEETLQGQRGQSPQGYKEESIRGQDKEVPQSQSERKQAQQGQECKTPWLREVRNSEIWGGVQEATVWHQEEGNPQGHFSDFCKSPEKLILQQVEKGIAGPQGASTQVTQAAATQEGAWGPPTPPQLQGTEGGILASEVQECQSRLPSALREQGGPRDLEPSKAAWPAPRSEEEALASAGQEVLQRLLELNGAARQRRRRDRERQRLRVLERLRIVANHHRRVHPLGLPPVVAQKAPQVDVAGGQRILRELLGQVQRGRTLQLRALGARNTQNFQELLSPGTEEPTPRE